LKIAAIKILMQSRHNLTRNYFVVTQILRIL